MRAVALAATVAASAVAIAVACTTLNDISLGVCGNQIVDPGEQCDTFGTDANVCYPPDAGARACHYECGDGGVCPTGARCGVDTVCRQPTGTFKAVPFIADDVRSLLIADFDGDGRLDVVSHGAGLARVHFFDDTGGMVRADQIDLSRGLVSTGHVTGVDGLASLLAYDIAVSAQTQTVSGTGLNVWRGQTDRTLAASLFQSFPIAGATDSRTIPATVVWPSRHPGADDLVIYVESPVGNFLAYFVPSGGYQVIIGFDAGLSLVGDVPTGRVPPAAKCDSLLVGYPDATVAQAVVACNADGGPNTLAPDGGATVAPTTISFPSPIAGPLFLVDVNNDGILDVVTSFAQNGPYAGIQAAFGDGAGGFGTAVQFTNLAVEGEALAIGDLDGDGIVDAVDVGGLALSSLGKPHIPAAGTLTYAQIHDLNNDGRLDAVAISSYGVDFYRGTGNAALDHRFYDVPNATALAAGDVDGDGNADLLVSAGAQPASLFVLFGNTGGFPDDPVPIGSVPATQHVSAAKVTWFFGDQSDSIATFVVMALNQNNQLVVVPIQGHTDRQLTAPFVLSYDQLANRVVPLAGAVATATVGDASTTNLAMIATPPIGAQSDADTSAIPLAVWTAQAVGGTTPFDTNFLSGSDAGVQLTTTLAQAAGIGVAAVDLDPQKGNGDELVIVVPSDSSGAGNISIGSYSGGLWQLKAPQPFGSTALTVGGATLPVRVSVADFDGDGLGDILIVAGAAGDAGTSITATVLFNDGHGNLVSAVTLPTADATAAAPLHTATDGTTQVIAVGPSSATTLFSVARGARTFAAAGLVLNGGSVGTTADVVCGDVNGDGVDDIVVGRSGNGGGIQVYLGVALIP